MGGGPASSVEKKPLPGGGSGPGYFLRVKKRATHPLRGRQATPRLIWSHYATPPPNLVGLGELTPLSFNTTHPVFCKVGKSGTPRGGTLFGRCFTFLVDLFFPPSEGRGGARYLVPKTGTPKGAYIIWGGGLYLRRVHFFGGVILSTPKPALCFPSRALSYS